jgi:hypothetical protein
LCDCDFITLRGPKSIVAISILDGSCVSREDRIAEVEQLLSILSAQLEEWKKV